MFKRSRLFVAIALLVQSFAFFIMFIILCAKKKSISAAFLAVSAMGGVAGGYLLYQEKLDWDEEMKFDALLEDEEFDDSIIDYDLRHGKDDDEMYEDDSEK